MPPGERHKQSGAVSSATNGGKPAFSQASTRLLLRGVQHESASNGAAQAGGVERSSVGVLFGGCGDGRHMLMTLIDAASSADQDGSGLQGAQLRIVLNDIVPEALARLYIVLALLHKAGKTLPDGELPPVWDLPDNAQAAIATVWHVYHSAQLCAPVHDALAVELQAVVASAAPVASCVRCTAGTWNSIQEVCTGWLDFRMSIKEEFKRAGAHQERIAGTGKDLSGMLPANLQARNSFCTQLSALVTARAGLTATCAFPFFKSPA